MYNQYTLHAYNMHSMNFYKFMEKLGILKRSLHDILISVKIETEKWEI